jgi:hypothetical protein
MTTASTKLIINFLDSFFQLFNADIENIKTSETQFTGIAVWKNEEEKQEFLWTIPKTEFNYEATIELINYLKQNRLMNGDMIGIARDLLIDRLRNIGWDFYKIEDSIKTLCSTRISMIDNGEITDCFLVHF